MDNVHVFQWFNTEHSGRISQAAPLVLMSCCEASELNTFFEPVAQHLFPALPILGQLRMIR